jgi:predicted neutral ceramidase superfamily lipid hydrolase
MPPGRAEDAGRDDRPERHETSTERLDRNWTDLLQELRVLQTGVQLLTGLLLTAVFQQSFGTLSSYLRAVYLASVGMSVLSTAALITPVALHRGLFRRHARASLVSAGQRLVLVGLTTLALAVTGVVLLIFSVAAGTAAGLVAAAVALLVFAGLWVGLPLAYRRHAEPPHPGPGVDGPDGIGPG